MSSLRPLSSLPGGGLLVREVQEEALVDIVDSLLGHTGDTCTVYFLRAVNININYHWGSGGETMKT